MIMNMNAAESKTLMFERGTNADCIVKQNDKLMESVNVFKYLDNVVLYHCRKILSVSF